MVENRIGNTYENASFVPCLYFAKIHNKKLKWREGLKGALDASENILFWNNSRVLKLFPSENTSIWISPPKSKASASSLNRNKGGAETIECAKYWIMLTPRRNKDLILIYVYIYIFPPQTKPKWAKDKKATQIELPLNKMLFQIFCKASRGL